MAFDAVDDVCAALERWGPDGPPLTRAMAALCRALDADLALTLSISFGPNGHGLHAFHASGLPGRPARAERLLHEWFEASDERWALYTPRRVERFQRNRVVRTASWNALRRGTGGPDISANMLDLTADEEQRMLDNLARGAAVFDSLQAGDMSQIRVLVCEGPTMLAWFGAMRERAFTDAEAHAVRRLTPAAVRCVRWEARLAHGSLRYAALEATLESLAGPAYVVSLRGAVLSANSAGRKRLARGRIALLRELDDARWGRLARRYERLEVGARGAPRCFVLRERRPFEASTPVALLAARHDLTPRERQVLGALVRGWSNRRIAAELGCAERTVEHHVSRALHKLDVATRAEAAAVVFDAARER